MENRKILLGLILIAALVLVVYYVPQVVQSNVPQQCLTSSGQCEHQAYLQEVILYLPLIIIGGFLLGVGVSYMYFERKVELPKTPAQEQAMLGMLPSDEKKVIAKLVAEGGRATQAEISRIDGIGKVKAHRIVERLEKRGAITKESSGKTNIIRLNKHILESVKSS
jgi:uncharacterized membrane protein